MDPYRNENSDIASAMEYVQESFELDRELHLDKKRRMMSVKEILEWDDYGSWGQWSPNELKTLSSEDLFEELRVFRGVRWAETALTWLQEGFPAIVLVQLHDVAAVADGRGRLGLAVGLGVKKLPVIELVERS